MMLQGGAFMVQGAAGPFDPANVTGYAQHFDATEITGLSDNDPVATWEDIASTNDATQGTASSRPIYKAAIQNSLPVVQFPGGDFLTHSYSNGGAAITIFLVAAVDSGLGTGYKGMYSTEGAGGDNAETVVLARLTSGTEWGTFADGTNRLANTNVRDDAWRVFAVSRSGAGGGDFYLNDSADGTFALSEGQAGHVGGVNTSQSLIGYIGEIIVYSAQLSAGDRGDVTTHLKDKWGIA